MKETPAGRLSKRNTVLGVWGCHWHLCPEDPGPDILIYAYFFLLITKYMFSTENRNQKKRKRKGKKIEIIHDPSGKIINY